MLSLVMVRVRSLTTQQRAKNRCQLPRPGVLGDVGRIFLWLIEFKSSGLGSVSAGFLTLRGLFSRALVVWVANINGEFDPGSGRTLAACLTHASRTVTWVLAPGDQ